MKDTPITIYFDPLQDTDNLAAEPAHLPTILDAGARTVKVGPGLQKVVEIKRRWPHVIPVHRDLGRLEEIMPGHGPDSATVLGIIRVPSVLNPSTKAVDAAAWWFKQFKKLVNPVIKANPDFDWRGVRWGGAWNEWGNWPFLEWYAEFEAERIRLMAEAGFKTLFGFFSAEARLWEPVPGETRSKVERFLPAFIAAEKYDAWFDHHCYNSPRLYDQGVMQNDVDDFMFAYRKVWAKLREVAPARVADYIEDHTYVGEVGADAIQYPSADPARLAKPYKGWQSCPGYTRELYTSDLMKVAAEMWRDGILGAAIYIDYRGENDGEYNISFRDPGYGKPGKPNYRPADYEVALRVAWAVAALPEGSTPQPEPNPTPEPEPEPPPPSTPQAGRYVVQGVDEYLRGRQLPTTNGTEVARFLPSRPPIDIETFVPGDTVFGNPFWGKLRGQNIYLSAKYLTPVSGA